MNVSMVEVEIFLGFFEQVEIVIPALSGLPGCLKFRNFNETISFQDAHRARKWSITLCKKCTEWRRVETEHLHIH